MRDAWDVRRDSLNSAYSLQPTAYSLQPTSLQPTAYSLQLMRIYTKILLTMLPLLILTLLAAGGLTYYLSYNALTDLARAWLESRLSEALGAAMEQEHRLHGPKTRETVIRQTMADTAAMSAINIGEAGYLFAVDSQGLITVHPDPSLIGRRANTERWFQEIRHTKKGSIRHPLWGVKSFAVHAYFPDRDWHLLAVAPESEIYGSLRQARIYLFFLAFLISGMMAMTLIFLTRRLLAPLKQLIAGTEQIGRGDMKARIPVSTSDELGQLAEVFNHMAAVLGQTLWTLQDRERLFRSLIENASDIIAILNEDGSVRYGSPAVRRVLGFDPKKLVGKATEAFVHPDDLGPITDLFTKTADHSKAVGSGGFRVRHKDGSWRTIEAIGKNLLDDPVVEGWIFNLRDVTDRNQAEAQVRESEEKYRNLFESAPEGIIITTPEGEVLSYNEAFRKIFKIDENDTWPERAADLYAKPEERPKMVELVKGNGKLEHFEQDHVDRQGRVFPASRSHRLIQYEGKTCIQTILRDVTRIKEMEAELRDYAENLERMVDENTGALKAANEELSKTVKSLEETREQLAVSAHQAGMAEIAVSVLHNIGNAVNSVNVRTCRLEEMSVAREVESLEKIRTLLQAEWPAQNEADQDRKEKLLAFFLMTIDIFRTKSDQFITDLRFVRSGMDHIMEIIAIQQKYAGLRGYETPVSLNDLLKDAVGMLMDSFKKRGIELEFDLHTLPDILLDRNKMIQIFINILKNAYESIETGPEENERRIQVKTSSERGDDGDHLQVMIADTGAGCPPEHRNEVFRFNFSTKGRGTGYGLHDAANTIRARDGIIDLLSEGPGKGACLLIKLPYRRRPDEQENHRD